MKGVVPWRALLTSRTPTCTPGIENGIDGLSKGAHGTSTSGIESWIEASLAGIAC